MYGLYIRIGICCQHQKFYDQWIHLGTVGGGGGPSDINQLHFTMAIVNYIIYIYIYI